MLVVGGGPAGASAAIYSARKGLNTGVVADKFGGQVAETVAIENFISVKATEGPKLVANLESHVREYDVDVIGGGNSAIAAAIDLANIVEHVTVLEFDIKLRADDVLQRKAASMHNITIITQAMTSEVLGDGSRVNGLNYTDRATGEQHDVELAGIFVQIG